MDRVQGTRENVKQEGKLNNKKNLLKDETNFKGKCKSLHVCRLFSEASVSVLDCLNQFCFKPV